MTIPVNDADMQTGDDDPVIEPEIADDTDDGDEETPPTDASTSRPRSSIKFPYNDLDDVIKVARTLHDARGGRAELSELAGELKQTAKSGTFRLRVSAARMFDLAHLQKKELVLTPLGKKIIGDGPEADSARVDAFLKVPLYREVYDEFHETQLPGDQGLENVLRRLGVTPNQVGRARQVLSRSAEQAGFFKTAGRTRLIKPSVTKIDVFVPDESANEPPPQDEHVNGGGQVELDGPLSDPILRGLFERLLPPIGKPFPVAGRRQLLTALAVNLDVVYGQPDDGQINWTEIGKLLEDKPASSPH